MADQKENKGFALPVPGQDGGEKAGAQVGQAAGDRGISTVQVNLGTGGDTSTRDLAVGVGVMVVLIVAFFFARNAYANWLVGRKVSPRSANAAGWWLFIFLTCLAAAGVFPLAAGTTFLSAIFLGPVLMLALAALVMILVSSRR